MKEFISFVKELFPSISPEAATNTIKAISGNFREKSHLEYCTPFPLNELSQGDVITNIPFRFINEKGELRKIDDALGFLLSYSCDVDNDDKVTFAAMLPIQKYIDIGFDEQNLINNKYTSLLYIPSPISDINKYIVDLSIVISVSPRLVERMLEEERMAKLVSLNQLGYYLMIAKLTVHLMRPEDKETHMKRECTSRSE